jgi:hypothetical protein
LLRCPERILLPKRKAMTFRGFAFPAVCIVSSYIAKAQF